MATLKGAEILAKALRANGVDTLFDIPGDPIGGILAAGRAEGMKTFSFRHEQAVAMAAQAFSYVRGECGVAVVASGPAMTNAVTGLLTAWANNWPMILVGGASEAGKRGLGDFPDVGRPAVHSVLSARGIKFEPELRRDCDLSAHRREGFA